MATCLGEQQKKKKSLIRDLYFTVIFLMKKDSTMTQIEVNYDKKTILYQIRKTCSMNFLNDIFFKANYFLYRTARVIFSLFN